MDDPCPMCILHDENERLRAVVEAAGEMNTWAEISAVQSMAKGGHANISAEVGAGEAA